MWATVTAVRASRNNDRLPWSNTIDLGAQYTWSLGTGNPGVQGRRFNLLNAQNLSGYSNNATQSNQVQVGPADSGVLVRRNAAPPDSSSLAHDIISDRWGLRRQPLVI